ncbi:MAG: heme-binding domain-containing protein [Vicingaceae bacterium]
MKKIVRKTLLGIGILMILFQFIPKNHNHSNEQMFIKKYAPPKEILNLLQNSCFDCHSNNTNYPWYGYIQPVTLFINHHVNEGKEEFNFDALHLYSDKKRNHKIHESIEEIEKDKMPLKSYTLLHSKAKLNKQQKETLINWLKTLNP